jgi:hypothetical protein
MLTDTKIAPSFPPADADGCGTDSLVNAGYPSNKDDPIPDDWHERRVLRTLPAYVVITAIYFLLPGPRETRDIEPL